MLHRSRAASLPLCCTSDPESLPEHGAAFEENWCETLGTVPSPACRLRGSQAEVGREVPDVALEGVKLHLQSDVLRLICSARRQDNLVPQPSVLPFSRKEKNRLEAGMVV